jgi:hypothetical protein
VVSVGGGCKFDISRNRGCCLVSDGKSVARLDALDPSSEGRNADAYGAVFIPSQATLSAGVVQITNTVTPTIMFPLSNMFAIAAGTTVTNTTTTAGAGLSLGASVAWQQNFTVQPVSDPFLLRNLGILYRAVLYPDAKYVLKSYKPPRIYDRLDHLVPDPYYLQRPLCVLCLNDPNDPPLTDARSDLDAKTTPNEVFTDHWLTWSRYVGPPDCPAEVPADKMCLGSSGGFAFFLQKEKLHDFTNFVLLTLPPTVSPTRFTSLAGPAVLPPAQPAPKKPRKGEPTPAVVPEPQIVPQYAPGPAEGTVRPNVIIPPTILQIPQ